MRAGRDLEKHLWNFGGPAGWKQVLEVLSFATHCLWEGGRVLSVQLGAVLSCLEASTNNF